MTNEEQENEQNREHSLNKFECFKCGCYFWVKNRNGFICPNCKENGVFTTPQEELTEEISLRLFEKSKHDKIKEEILRGLNEL